MPLCYVLSQRIQELLTAYFRFNDCKKKNSLFVFGWDIKSAPNSLCLFSLSKPHDAKCWSSGPIFLSYPQTPDRFLYSCTLGKGILYLTQGHKLLSYPCYLSQFDVTCDLYICCIEDHIHLQECLCHIKFIKEFWKKEIEINLVFFQ